ncbi:MAG TPA: MauE/DoxX family redox-associated membrane protein, partial [Burkholderiales bacterium]
MEVLAFAADPVTVGTLVGALALIMFAAAWHKFSEADEFAGALAAYRLLPQVAVAVVARALPVVEVAIGAGILIPATRSWALIAL